MLIFRKVKDVDFINYKKIFDMGNLLFGFTKEDCFIEKDGNRENVIFYCPPLFMKFFIDENNEVKTSSFYVGEDNRIMAFTYLDYQININDTGIVFIHENGNIYFLNLLCNDSRSEDVENNGVLVFAQYDKKQDIRVVSKYIHNVWCGNNKIFSQRLEEPYSVTLENRVHFRDKGLKFIGHKDSYYRMDFNIYRNRWQYDLATLKEYGVGAVMAQDTYSLQDKEEFSKYYKILFSFGDYVTITGFPFTRQYDGKNIMDLIKRFGFSENVPDIFIRIYNNMDELMRENEEILAWYLKNINQNKVYSKAI